MTPRGSLAAGGGKLFLLTVLLYVFSTALIVVPFLQLPSPLFGGDLYYQQGSVYHISQTGPREWFQSSNFGGDSLPCNMPVYGALIGLLVRLFGLDPFTAMKAGALLLAGAAVSVHLLLFQRLFGDRVLSTVGVLVFLPVTELLILNYTSFTRLVAVPLFVLALAHFVRKMSPGRSLLLGGAYGLAGLSHQVAFIGATLLMVLMLLVAPLLRAFVKRRREEGKASGTKVPPAAPLVLTAFLLGFVIALPYWYKPIFVFHGRTLNGDQNFQFGFHDLSFRITYFLETLGSIFADGGSVFLGTVSAFSLLGLLALSFGRGRKEESFVRALFLSSLVIFAHYFVTQPLLGTNFVPGHLQRMFLSLSAFLLFLTGLKVVRERLKGLEPVLFAGLALLIVVHNISVTGAFLKDKWVQRGYEEMEEHYPPLREWVLGNTYVGDTFLSTNELSFAVNALTGRKNVLSRRAHNDKFMDIDVLQLAGGTMLYSADLRERLALIEKYDVKYLYWNHHWIWTDYIFSPSGRIENFFDPVAMRYAERHEQSLRRSGIDYFRRRTWLDPRYRGPEVPKLDLLFVSPANYRSAERPWREGLEDFMEEVWSFGESGSPRAALYRFDRRKVREYLAAPRDAVSS